MPDDPRPKPSPLATFLARGLVEVMKAGATMERLLHSEATWTRAQHEADAQFLRDKGEAL